MERADWVGRGLSPRDARFLLVTEITHHRFRSKLWGGEAARRLYGELAEMDAAGDEILREAERAVGEPPPASTRERSAPWFRTRS